MPGKINRQRTVLSALHSSHVASQRKTTQWGSWLEKLPAWGILALTPTDPRGYSRFQRNISGLLIWGNLKNSVAEISFYRWKAGADLSVRVFTYCGSSGQKRECWYSDSFLKLRSTDGSLIEREVIKSAAALEDLNLEKGNRGSIKSWLAPTKPTPSPTTYLSLPLILGVFRVLVPREKEWCL